MRSCRTLPAMKLPAPTLVTYALAIPQISSMSFGPTPAPMQADAAIGFDEVTKGYVPWSMSSSTPWAPSNSTVWPLSSCSCTSRAVSEISRSIRWP